MATADDDAVIEAWARGAAGEVAGDVVGEMAAPLADLRDRLALLVDRIDRHVADATGPVPYPWKALQAMRQDLAALYLSTTSMAELGSELAAVFRGLGAPAVAVDVEHTVEAAVRLVGHRIGARTELLVDAGSVPHVAAPAAELTVAIARMIAVCARSADRAEHAALSVRTRADGAHVVISAADNGAGAADDCASLAAVLTAFAAAHGGSFAGTSEADQGSALELRLPAVAWTHAARRLLRWEAMTTVAREEAHGLFTVLAVSFAVVVGALAALGTRPVTPVGLGAIFVPWAALSFALFTHRETWGREGRYLDLWSISHAGAGVVAWALGIELAHLVILTVVWEVIEISARVHEHPANRVIDIALAICGWQLSAALG